jgi:hypothetical protein
MKYCWLTCLVVFCLAGLGSAQNPAPNASNSLEKSLIANERSFLAAAKKGDLAYLQHVLTDDFSQVGIDGQMQDREDVLDELSDGGVERTPYNFKVVAAGGGVEIVTYDAVVRIPPKEDEGPPPRYQHWSSVWVRQGGVWKLKFQQTTPTHWGDW